MILHFQKANFVQNIGLILPTGNSSISALGKEGFNFVSLDNKRMTQQFIAFKVQGKVKEKKTSFLNGKWNHEKIKLILKKSIYILIQQWNIGLVYSFFAL